MPSVRWYVNRDTRTARRVSDSVDFGSGVSNALPFGTHAGYWYRSYLGFYGNSTAGWTEITAATLTMRTSNQLHVAFGSNPLGYIDRVVEAWGEGTADGLSTTNATIFPGPGAVSSNHATLNPPLTENTFFNVDITAMMVDAYNAAELGYGFRLSASDQSSGHVGEIWAREQGSTYRAYIDIDYELNRAPATPTLTAPAAGATVSTDTPTFSFTSSDPDPGQTMSKYDLQVATDSGFTVLHYDGPNLTSGMSGWAVDHVYAGPAFTPGNTYYWRARVYDPSATASAYSAGRIMVRDVLPGVIHDGAWARSGSGAFAPNGRIVKGGQAQFGVSNVYPQTVLAANPRAYWSLDDSSGNPQDVSGNDHDVTTVGGTPTYGTPSPSGDATTSMTFDGASEYLEIANDADIHPGDVITIEAWFKRSAINITQHIFDNGAGDAEVYIGSDNKVYFGVTGIAVLLVSSTTYADTNWHHVVAVKNGATRLLYVDGVSVGTGGTAATIVASSSGTRIGAKV
jgi:hypothetical protein